MAEHGATIVKAFAPADIAPSSAGAPGWQRVVGRLLTPAMAAGIADDAWRPESARRSLD